MTKKSLAFIGAGRVTRILLEAWRRDSGLPARVVLCDPDEAARQKSRELFPSIEIHADNEPALACDLVFLAVHPPVIPRVLGQLAGRLKKKALLVSLAPKWSLAAMEKELGGFNRLARMIPNAPSMVGRGLNPIVFSPVLGQADKRGLLDLFKPCGECLVVVEEKLSAYALISFMGPSYFWFQLQELIEIAEECGLTARESQLAVLRMAAGAAAIFEDSGWPLEEISDLVALKPLAEDEDGIRRLYRSRLLPLLETLREE